MDSPWKKIGTVDEGREYLALLTYLPLLKYRMIPRFLRFSFEIQRQLTATAGVVGYALRAKPFRRDFWTLSVWQDEKSLMDFVIRNPHGDIMKSLSTHMGRTKFTRWQISGSAVPPQWEDAMGRWRSEEQYA